MIPTPDGERVYAWLVLPLRVYAENVGRLTKDGEVAFAARPGDRQAVEILRRDERSRLIIYCMLRSL